MVAGMFDAAERGRRLAKPAYQRAVEHLRVRLLEAQDALAASNFSLALIVGGVEGSGKTEFANHLLTWLDARGVQTHALGEPSDEERERPDFWRFWRILPARGRTAIFLTSWYTDPVVGRVFKRLGEAELDERLDRIVQFERMLSRENVLLVKLWFHISKKEQGDRLKVLEENADTRWR